MANGNFPKKGMLIRIGIASFVLLGCLAIPVGLVQHQINETFNVDLAEDAQTKEYLGEVIVKIKDSRTGRIVRYQIKRNGGEIIERSAESVNVFKP